MRENMWRNIKARKHAPQKVYVNDLKGDELMLFGTVCCPIPSRSPDGYRSLKYNNIRRSRLVCPAVPKSDPLDGEVAWYLKMMTRSHQNFDCLSIRCAYV
jgi:hypothetical protein